MVNTVLISDNKIVNKIFSLVANKLAIKLKVSNNCDILDTFDIVFLDENYLDENLIQLKAITKKFILISSKTTTTINDFDYIIQKPFLPSKLQNELQDIIRVIGESSVLKDKEETKDDVSDLVDFVDSMFDDTNNIDNDADESIILEQNLGHGGVLDKNELSKLFEMVNDEVTQEIDMDDENDWVELADIIDKAIDDVAEYEFEENKPIKLILNEYSMEELKPLFQRLDQEIIDKLVNGEDISLQLRLGKQ